LAWAVAGAAELEQEFALRRPLLYPVVSVIGYVYKPILVEADAPWGVELAFAVAKTPPFA